MVNVLLLEIGDEVVVNGNKKGKVVGFCEIALSEKSCFRNSDCLSGVYRDPALARVRIENSKVIDVYFNNLEIVDSEEYIKRVKLYRHYRRRFVRKFPETPFCEGDKVLVKSESIEKICDLIRKVIEAHKHRKPQMFKLGIDFGKEPEPNLKIFFVMSINYHLNNGSSDLDVTYDISDRPYNFHWHIAVEENCLELLEQK